MTLFRPPRRVGGIIPALVVTTAALATGQSYRVGVSITENTGGLFKSAFSSSLRALKDVEVVTPEERPELLFKIVVLCEPDDKECESARSYTMAIQLVEPLTLGSAKSSISTIGHVSGVSKKLSYQEWDSLGTLLFSYFRAYEYPQGLWTLSWGRNVYRRAVDEFIAHFDSKCLERKRLLVRMNKMEDTAAVSALIARVVDKEGQEKWMC